MMKHILIVVSVFVSLSSLYGQKTIADGIARDTSFTLHSAYVKEKKYRPYIEKVTAQLPAHVTAFENIVYSTPYANRDLVLNVYRPSDNEIYPALIMVFGGGWSSGSLTMQIPMAQQIAEKGYVTIPVEYRLSPEAQYPAALYDLKTAVRWVRANADRYGIDTAKVAISGCSAGGQLAALTGITNGQAAYEDKKEYAEYSSTIQAVINIDGVTNFLGAELDSNREALSKKKKTPAAVRWLGGTIEEKEENWIAASPVYHITPQSPPICFINSSIPRFHDGRDKTVEKLNTWGIYSEVHTIPDTPHPFWLFRPWFDTNVGYMIGFLDKILKNK